MSNVSIPTPNEAAQLRAIFGTDHPVVVAVLDALTAFTGVDGLDVRTAAALLPYWAGYDQLSRREVQAVLATMVSEPQATAPRPGSFLDAIHSGEVVFPLPSNEPVGGVR